MVDLVYSGVQIRLMIDKFCVKISFVPFNKYLLLNDRFFYLNTFNILLNIIKVKYFR